MCPSPLVQHRELVRAQLHSLLQEYHPLQLYTTDKRKYFYVGEALAQIDLSLVSGASWCQPLCLVDGQAT